MSMMNSYFWRIFFLFNGTILRSFSRFLLSHDHKMQSEMFFVFSIKFFFNILYFHDTFDSFIRQNPDHSIWSFCSCMINIKYRTSVTHHCKETNNLIHDSRLWSSNQILCSLSKFEIIHCIVRNMHLNSLSFRMRANWSNFYNSIQQFYIFHKKWNLVKRRFIYSI